VRQGQREAVLSRLADRLREQNSWCGETHVQKSAYLLQEMLDVPLGYDFTLYKYGPFSFDLRDEIGEMRAEELIGLDSHDRRYGPRFVITDEAHHLQSRYSRTLAEYEPMIDFVAEQVGDRGVLAVERLATAFYVTHTNPHAPAGERVEALCQLKPHIQYELAADAVREVDEIIERAQTVEPTGSVT
jgi:hypothetical protein